MWFWLKSFLLGAPANIFKKLLDLGAYKSVKNANNETPHDIALKKGNQISPKSSIFSDRTTTRHCGS